MSFQIYLHPIDESMYNDLPTLGLMSNVPLWPMNFIDTNMYIAANSDSAPL